MASASGSPLLLAFSGGPDSVGLALAMRESGRAVLAGYVDHGLRGRRESRRERVRVRGLARTLGLELRRARLALPAADEARARHARYRALAAMARASGCAGIAVAHTADDRAETILFNLLRGTGLRGLAAPRARVVIDGVPRVRPALHVRRDALRRPAAALVPVVDPTNRSTGRARARIRRLHMPALARALGEDPVPLLCGLGDLATTLRDALERRAAARAPGAGRRELLAECNAVFPYAVEALRIGGPPLTANAYASLRAFLRAGRTGRSHRTPGGETWSLVRGGGVIVER